MRMAADYAKTRFQFGRAIGSFQAVKHMCADMLLEAESAVSAARHVAAAFDADDAHAVSWIWLLAQSYCSDAFVFVAATTSRCTAASASPGSIPLTCICAGPAPTPSCSATRPGTANATCG